MNGGLICGFSGPCVYTAAGLVSRAPRASGPDIRPADRPAARALLRPALPRHCIAFKTKARRHKKQIPKHKESQYDARVAT